MHKCLSVHAKSLGNKTKQARSAYWRTQFYKKNWSIKVFILLIEIVLWWNIKPRLIPSPIAPMHNCVKRTKLTTRPRLRDIFSNLWPPSCCFHQGVLFMFAALAMGIWKTAHAWSRHLCLCVPQWGLAKQNYNTVFEITADRVENQSVPDYCELRRTTGGWLSFPGRLIIVHFNKWTLDWKKAWIWNGTSRTSQTMYGVVRPFLPVMILCVSFQISWPTIAETPWVFIFKNKYYTAEYEKVALCSCL